MAQRIPVSKRYSFMTNTLQYFTVAILTLFGVWLLYRGIRFYWELFSPEQQIKLDRFYSSGPEPQMQVEFAADFFRARLLETERILQAGPNGAVPLVSVVSTTGETSLASRVSELDLKVKDVDVNSLFRFLTTFMTPSGYELSGTVIQEHGETKLTCILTRNEKNVRTWYARKISEKDASAVLPELLDDVMYQMIFDLLGDQSFEVAKGEGHIMHSELSDWRNLKTYVEGRRALDSYYSDLDPLKLQQAREDFEKTVLLAPTFGEGIFYSGIALAESRMEEAAAERFKRVQELENVNPRLQHEAAYNQAAALLRLYRLEPAENAIHILDETISSLSRQHSGIEDADRVSLLALCLAQRAYTRGTMLAFFRYKKPPREIEDYWQRINGDIDSSRKILSGSKLGNSELNQAASWVDNAEGYSIYRHAFFEADNLYKSECERAIQLLRRAMRARPNHYEILQNLAMIYEDERFDESGQHLDDATRLFEYTSRYVPDDYYQYEQLAKIQLRKAMREQIAERKEALLTSGINYGEKSLKLRPGAGEALMALGRLSWTKGRDQHDKTDLENAEKFLRKATEVRPTDAAGFLYLGEFLVIEKKNKIDGRKILEKVIELTNNSTAYEAIKNRAKATEILRTLGS